VAVPPLPEVAPPAPLVVLVADDNAAVRAQLARLLAQEGCRVEQAADAAAAAAALAAGAIDLVLADSELPGLPAGGPAALAPDRPVAALGQPLGPAPGLAGILKRPVAREALAALLRTQAGGPDEAAGPAVDAAHLERFTNGDLAFERELAAVFLPSAAGYIDDLAATGDPAHWKRQAHTLKGAARGLGAVALGALAEAAEGAFVPEGAGRRLRVRAFRLELARVGRWFAARQGE